MDQNIVSRHALGLAPPTHDPVLMALPAARVFLHHTVTQVTADPAADWRRVQEVAFERGWSDISYSYGVHPGAPGQVFEGRSENVGAHTIDNAGNSLNEIAFGVVLIGNYEDDEVPESMIESVRWIVAFQKARGFLVETAVLEPHRAVYATACPGQHAMEVFDRFQAPLDVVVPPAPPMPPTPPGPAPEPDPVGPPWPGSYLRQGHAGPDVVTVQARLAERGWTIAVDGRFGPETDRVVRAFQADKGLGVDGVVGPITWDALWSTPITP